MWHRIKFTPASPPDVLASAQKTHRFLMARSSAFNFLISVSISVTLCFSVPVRNFVVVLVGDSQPHNLFAKFHFRREPALHVWQYAGDVHSLQLGIDFEQSAQHTGVE